MNSNVGKMSEKTEKLLFRMLGPLNLWGFCLAERSEHW